MQPNSDSLPPAEPVSETVMATLMGLGRLVRQTLPDDEVEHTSMPLLKVLRETGPQRSGALAERLHLDASTVSRQVQHLERRGLVTACHDENDRRARVVALSDRGRTVLARMGARRRDLIEGVLADWPADDLDTLRRLLRRFNDDLADRPLLAAATPDNPSQEDA